MTDYTADAGHQPKGDHNRRVSLGLAPEEFAVEAGITVEQLRDYERTSPDHDYDLDVAQRIKVALERLERTEPNLQTGRMPGHSAPVLDPSQQPRLGEHELTGEVLEGATIYGAGNEEVGRVSHLHGSGANAQVVVDVGGFLGFGAKPVAIPVSQLDFLRGDDGHINAVTNWTKEDLKALPDHRDL